MRQFASQLLQCKGSKHIRNYYYYNRFIYNLKKIVISWNRINYENKLMEITLVTAYQSTIHRWSQTSNFGLFLEYFENDKAKWYFSKNSSRVIANNFKITESYWEGVTKKMNTNSNKWFIWWLNICLNYIFLRF